jgi:hypothetical protein
VAAIMMASRLSHRNRTMKPTTPLKRSAIAFTVLWSGWMLWWSGSYDPANIIILAGCGALAGCAWYYAMRWVFRFIHLLPQNDHSVDPGARQ